MASYDDCNEQLKAFKKRYRVIGHSVLLYNNYSVLAQLFGDLLDEIQFNPNIPDEDAFFLFEKTLVLLQNLSSKHINLPESNEALQDFKTAFDMKCDPLTEKLTTIAATIAGLITGLLSGLLFGVISPLVMYNVYSQQRNWKDGVKAVLCAPFELACYGGVRGYQSAETLVLGTPRAITKKIDTIGFFTVKTMPSMTDDSNHSNMTSSSNSL